MKVIPLTRKYEKYGKKIFNWYSQFGAKPESVFLDAGCCTLAPGIFFIDFLNQGNFFGFDKEPEAILIAKNEVEKRGLQDKQPVLWATGAFDLTPVTKPVDFVLGNSLISHCDLETTSLLLESLKSVIHPGTKIILTYHESKGKDVIVGTKHRKRKVGNEFTKVEYSRPFLTKVLAEHGYVVDEIVHTITDLQEAVSFRMGP